MIAVEQARKHTAVLYGDIAEIIYGKQDKGAQHAGAPAGQKGEQICACKPQKPRMPAQGVYARVAYAAAIALYVGFAKGQGKKQRIDKQKQKYGAHGPGQGRPKRRR